MTPFEYLITLVSVLVGLALADVATSLHHLLRARARVHWDGLPLAAALLAVLAVLQFWWTLFGAQDLGPFGRIAGFLPLMAQVLLLYLLNAAALPDAVPADGLNLRTFYRENSRYFWSLYAGYIAVTILLTLGQRTLGGETTGRVLSDMAPDFVILASFLFLAYTRKRWIHSALMSIWFVVFMASWWGLRLSP